MGWKKKKWRRWKRGSGKRRRRRGRKEGRRRIGGRSWKGEGEGDLERGWGVRLAGPKVQGWREGRRWRVRGGQQEQGQFGQGVDGWGLLFFQGCHAFGQLPKARVFLQEGSKGLVQKPRAEDYQGQLASYAKEKSFTTTTAKGKQGDGEGETNWDALPVGYPAFLVQPMEGSEDPWEPITLVKEPLVGKAEKAKVKLWSLLKGHHKDLAKKVIPIDGDKGERGQWPRSGQAPQEGDQGWGLEAWGWAEGLCSRVEEKEVGGKSLKSHGELVRKREGNSLRGKAKKSRCGAVSPKSDNFLRGISFGKR